MSLTEQAIQDNKKITGNSKHWGVKINLTAPNGKVVDVIGLHTKHHLGFDSDGVRLSTKTSSVAISEDFLTDLAYPVRNLTKEVFMIDHLVKVNDSTRQLNDYIVLESYPDEKLGMIILILGDYE